jgi:DtxR family Mn-dependent transcriptional regulator
VSKSSRRSSKESEEELLEAIYRLEEKEGSARTSDLASMLKASSLGSITSAVESLEERGLVRHRPYHGVKLANEGRRKALAVIRRHRLSERLLTDVLHLRWSDVHEAACKLEHSLTKPVINAIEKTLGRPRTCPHGNPIPSSSGEVEEVECEPMIKVEPGQSCTIVKIVDEDPQLLQYFASLGIFPGAKAKVEEKAPFGGPILLRILGTSYALGREPAASIWVRRAVSAKAKAYK